MFGKGLKLNENINIFNLTKEERIELISHGDDNLLILLLKKINEMTNDDIKYIPISRIEKSYKLLKEMRDIIKPIEELEDIEKYPTLTVELPKEWISIRNNNDI